MLNSYKTVKRMTNYQNQMLLKMFEANAYPGKEELCQIARSLSTSVERIVRWMTKMRLKKRANGVLLKGE